MKSLLQLAAWLAVRAMGTQVQSGRQESRRSHKIL